MIKAVLATGLQINTSAQINFSIQNWASYNNNNYYYVTNQIQDSL